jgi:hypothetical protein
MNPGGRVAGAAGMIAGVLLVFETSCFLLSGWSPAAFADPAQAIALLRQGGNMLRAAAVFGFVGLVATTYLIAGLAFALHGTAPGRATRVLYFGLVGVAGHSLVPLGLWTGIPAFLDFASKYPVVAGRGWVTFAAVSDAAHGIGSLFMGAAMLLAGWAMAAGRDVSPAAGWVGVAAGVLTVASLIVIGTPGEGVGVLLFLPTLALTVAFRFWTGAALWRNARASAASPADRI